MEARLENVSLSILDLPNDDEYVSKILYYETLNIRDFHIDLMDGKFVEKDTYEEMLEKVNLNINYTLLQNDLHFMGYDIFKAIDDFAMYISCFTIHFEVLEKMSKEDNKGISEIILEIKNRLQKYNISLGLSFRPNTKIDKILNYIKYFSKILVMSVEPGYGGQKFLDQTFETLKILKKYIDENNLTQIIQIDGGINPETILKLKEEELFEFIDIFVVGSYITNSNTLKNAKLLKEHVEKLEESLC